MVAPTRTRIIKIGKSKIVRIPQRMLDRVGLGPEVELAASVGRIVIQPVLGSRRPRQGWKKSFKKMVVQSGDRLLLSSPVVWTDWDASEWQW